MTVHYCINSTPFEPPSKHEEGYEMSWKPLRGVRVVEAGTYFSAPLASMMLADLGAHVVKVEPPSGDPFRRYGLRHNGVSAAWVNANHGKTVAALDLKADD